MLANNFSLGYVAFLSDGGRQMSTQADMKDCTGRNKLTTFSQMDKQVDMKITRSVQRESPEPGLQSERDY